MATKFWTTIAEDWNLVTDELEPWRAPAAKVFEAKRLQALAQLRRLIDETVK